MKESIPPKALCRYCRHYTAEGRRGGTCEQLGVSVQSHWSACSLMLPSLNSEPVLAVEDTLPMPAVKSVVGAYDRAQPQSGFQVLV